MALESATETAPLDDMAKALPVLPEEMRKVCVSPASGSFGARVKTGVPSAASSGTPKEASAGSGASFTSVTPTARTLAKSLFPSLTLTRIEKLDGGVRSSHQVKSLPDDDGEPDERVDEHERI